MVWVGILGVLWYSSIVIWCVERKTDMESFPDEDLVDGVHKSLFLGMEAFLGAGDMRYQPRSTGGRAILLGLSFFILVTTTYCN